MIPIPACRTHKLEKRRRKRKRSEQWMMMAKIRKNECNLRKRLRDSLKRLKSRSESFRRLRRSKRRWMLKKRILEGRSCFSSKRWKRSW